MVCEEELSSQSSSNKNHFGDFYHCDTSISGLRRLLHSVSVSAVSCLFDSGGLITCWTCFVFLFLSDTETISQCLALLCDSDKCCSNRQSEPLVTGNCFAFFVWLHSGQTIFSLAELNSPVSQKMMTSELSQPFGLSVWQWISDTNQQLLVSWMLMGRVSVPAAPERLAGPLHWGCSFCQSCSGRQKINHFLSQMSFYVAELSR